MLLFEGGKSLDLNDTVTQEAVEGTKRFLHHLEMLNPRKKTANCENKTIYIEKSNWIRAKYSGMFHGLTAIGSFVKKGDLLAEIETDKATMELESYQDGILLHIGTPRGGKLQVNDLLAIFGKEGEDISALIAGANVAPVAAPPAASAPTEVPAAAPAAGPRPAAGSGQWHGPARGPLCSGPTGLAVAAERL